MYINSTCFQFLTKFSSRDAQKFFKDGKLKYPDVDTTKQSKKYVRALKLLKVRRNLTFLVSVINPFLFK